MSQCDIHTGPRRTSLVCTSWQTEWVEPCLSITEHIIVLWSHNNFNQNIMKWQNIVMRINIQWKRGQLNATCQRETCFRVLGFFCRVARTSYTWSTSHAYLQRARTNSWQKTMSGSLLCFYCYLGIFTKSDTLFIIDATRARICEARTDNMLLLYFPDATADW